MEEGKGGEYRRKKKERRVTKKKKLDIFFILRYSYSPSPSLFFTSALSPLISTVTTCLKPMGVVHAYDPLSLGCALDIVKRYSSCMFRPGALAQPLG